MEPPRYTPPSKALIRDLSSDIRALARNRLAEQLQYYQTIRDLDDTDIADAMNACAAVIGNRGTGEQVFAPISPKKIERFKDEAIRPQTNTLIQMTTFFEETIDMPRFLAWADMDDVLTAYHDARRFRNDRVQRKLITLAGGWIFISLFEPTAVMAIQLTQLSAHPPPRQNSCRLDWKPQSGARGRRRGSIRTRIQGQGGSAVVAAGECKREGRGRRGGRVGGDVGTMEIGSVGVREEKRWLDGCGAL